MLVRRLVLTVLATMAACSALAASPPLTANGWGKLRIGMRERDAAKLFHMRIPRGIGPDSFECRQDEVPSQEGMAVMAQRGIITRITLSAPNRLLTDRGLGIGSTEAEVRRAYGQTLKVMTTPYEEEPAHDLTFWAFPGKRGVRYDTNIAGSVEAIYVGSDAINLIEGCS
ncbi:hypothetical protein [Phenylobacterium sp.]|uniref:hypothetical protein n=1 Tax=Phenylobacterium sp. TaxID=1871053 RepID=UPI001206A09E|nr:hypothetical protein [Phenylobacterium sp.]THD68677.1 MAG: hypothetical protein E8A12_04120 [Phenylobacterium sp.]